MNLRLFLWTVGMAYAVFLLARGNGASSFSDRVSGSYNHREAVAGANLVRHEDCFTLTRTGMGSTIATVLRVKKKISVQKPAPIHQ